MFAEAARSGPARAALALADLDRIAISTFASSRWRATAPSPERASRSPTSRDVRALEEQLAASRRELDEAHEELQSAVEELETTNEELQSTNEELETTNEELQSTNEELETMNEELQSTNEELETMNEELRERSVELNDVNAFLETILTSMGIAVVVLDTRLHVQIWNAHSRELWGLTPQEVEGSHILDLDFGLPVDALKAPLKACLSGTTEREELVLDAVNRRGKPFRCGVVCLPLNGPDAPTGVIVMMEPREG